MWIAFADPTTPGSRISPAPALAGYSDYWWLDDRGDPRNSVFVLTTQRPRDRWSVPVADVEPGSNSTGQDVLGAVAPQLIQIAGLASCAYLALTTYLLGAHSRPRSNESEISRCAVYLSNPVLRYFTGRGAQDEVLDAWLHFLSRREYALRRLESEWISVLIPAIQQFEGQVLTLSTNTDIQLGVSQFVAEALSPLCLLDSSRELGQVIPELRHRLISLQQQCERASRELGVMGTLASLALVPVSDLLGWWFLVPIAITTLLYLFGYRIASKFDSLLRPHDKEVKQTRSSCQPELVGFLTSFFLTDDKRLQSTNLVVGRLCSPAELAAVIDLSRCMHRQFASHVFVNRDSRYPLPDRCLIVGGPLVRESSGSAKQPAVDITRLEGDWWVANMGSSRPAPIARAALNERMGFVAQALPLGQSLGDTLFLMGTREIGTITVIESIRGWVMGESQLVPGGYALQAVAPSQPERPDALLWVSSSRRATTPTSLSPM